MRAFSGDEIVLPVFHEDNGPGGCQSIFLTRRGDKLRKQEVRSLGPIKGGYIILGELSKTQTRR